MKKTVAEKMSGNSLARSISRLSRYEDVDEVLTNLTKMLKRSLKGRWVVVYQLDQDKGGFLPVRSCGLSSEWDKRFSSLQFLPVRQPLLRRLLSRRRCLSIDNPATSNLLSPVLQKTLRKLTILAVPMVVRDHVNGVVIVARTAGSRFTAAETAVARELVAQAALVSSHLRLLDESLEMALEVAKRVDIILMLDDINKAVSSSLSLEKIAVTAIERIEGVVESDLQVLLETRGDDFVVLASRSDSLPLPDELLHGRIVAGSGILRRAAVSGEIQLLQEMQKTSKPLPLKKALASAGIRSLLVAPFLGNSGARGLMLLGDSRPDHFCNEENFAVGKIASQLAVAMENARLYHEMRQLFFNTVASLANAIDAKSPWTKGHSERVMRVSAKIAENMGLTEDDVERVRLGGLLHDVGKIGIIEALLEKPAELSSEEFPPLRLHPEKGVAILQPIAQLRHVLPGILHHHEFYGGGGYPYGIAGDEIPLDARIIAVADAFDAMVADRPYRKGLSIAAAVSELVRCSGSQFDPEIVDCFRHHLAKVTRDASLAEGALPGVPARH